MTFLEHLGELRSSLRRALAGYVLGVVVAGFFSEQLFVWLVQPLAAACAEAGVRPTIHFSSPVEPFWVYFKVALVAGLFLSAPVLFWQLWRFVSPGLYKREKRLVVPFALGSGLLFAAGAAFCQFVVLPLAYPFFLGFAKAKAGAFTALLGHRVEFAFGQSVEITPVFMMEQVLSFAMRMLLAFGLVFELPLLLSFLAYAGLVTAKGLWRWNKYAVIIAFLLGGILTPGPDILSQCLMSLPLWGLYNLSIAVAWLLERARGSRQDSDDSNLAEDHIPAAEVRTHSLD